MRATMVAMLVFCAGCFNYDKLSAGEVAEMPDASDTQLDGGGGDGAVVAPSDLAGLDLAGVDLAGWDGAQPSADMAPFYPATCAEVRLVDPGAVDGAFTLYVAKNPAKPWTAFCKDMAATPKEYLSLVNTGTNQNFSQYTAGGYSPGTDVKTNYTRIRLDPTTLKVDTSDQTYSTSTGLITSANAVSMPYAVAMDCYSSLSSHVGAANVDLRNTPFAIAPGAFSLGGFLPSGTSTYSSANQVAFLTGGGGCGWGPSGTAGAGGHDVDVGLTAAPPGY
jgi:hypothetical protein